MFDPSPASVIHILLLLLVVVFTTLLKPVRFLLVLLLHVVSGPPPKVSLDSPPHEVVPNAVSDPADI